MIEYLTKRLEQAEQAIQTCEEIIGHERSNRKEMSMDLKERNATLKALIENEKKSLSDKVSTELEGTLQMAVKEKVQLDKLYKETLNELQTKSRELDELNSSFFTLQKRSVDYENQINTQTNTMAEMQQEISKLQEQTNSLTQENTKLREETKAAI